MPLGIHGQGPTLAGVAACMPCRPALAVTGCCAGRAGPLQRAGITELRPIEPVRGATGRTDICPVMSRPPRGMRTPGRFGHQTARSQRKAVVRVGRRITGRCVSLLHGHMVVRHGKVTVRPRDPRGAAPPPRPPQDPVAVPSLTASPSAARTGAGPLAPRSGLAPAGPAGAAPVPAPAPAKAPPRL